MLKLSLHFSDGLELFIHKFFLFLKLQVVLINLYVIHYFSILHTEYLCPLLQYFLSISIIFCVYLQKVIMISLEPFPFTPV